MHHCIFVFLAGLCVLNEEEQDLKAFKMRFLSSATVLDSS